MANENNLHPIELTHEEAVRNGRKGGIASAKARKRKKAFIEALNTVLDKTYTDENGESLTGYELIATTLFNEAINGNSRQSISAIRLILDATGCTRTDGELKKEELTNKLKESEIRLTNERVKVLESSNEPWEPLP